MLTEDDVVTLIENYLKANLLDENELIEIIKRYLVNNPQTTLKWIDLR